MRTGVEGFDKENIDNRVMDYETAVQQVLGSEKWEAKPSAPKNNKTESLEEKRLNDTGRCTAKGHKTAR